MYFFLSVGLLKLCSLFSVAQAALGPRAFDWNEVKYFYVFGDSYSFVQGTLGHANYSFIGDELNLGFTPSQLLSDQIIVGNTSSDGANWVEFLTTCFEGTPSDCPRQVWDFAFAGADIDATLLPLHHKFSIQMVDQVKQWATYAVNVIPHPPKETMTAWWIGINDTGDTLNNTTITDFQAFWEAEMDAYFQAVQMAYDRGLNSTHLFINVPPEERAPGHVFDTTGGPVLRQNIIDFNTVLAERINVFAQENPSATVLTFDAHAWFNSVLDNAEMYGFRNITGYCTCTDPTFFWYNTGHPTERVHQLLAKALEIKLLEANT